MVDSIVKLLKEIYLCKVDNVENISQFDRSFSISLDFDTYNHRKKFTFAQGYEAEVNLSKTMYEKKNIVDLELIMNISTSDMGKTIDIIVSNRYYNPKTLLQGFCTIVSQNIQFVARFYLKLAVTQLEKSKIGENVT